MTVEFRGASSGYRRRLLERRLAALPEPGRPAAGRRPLTLRSLAGGLLLVLFAAGVVDFHGAVPPSLRLDEKLSPNQRYRARVDFTFFDESLLDAARDLARRGVPSYYVEVAGWEAQMLDQWLAAVTQPARRSELPELSPAEQQGLTALDARLADPARASAAAEVLREAGSKALAYFWEKGLLAQGRYDEEHKLAAAQIRRLQRSPPMEARDWPGANLLPLGKEGRSIAAQQLDPALQDAARDLARQQPGSDPTAFSLDENERQAAGLLLGLGLEPNLEYDGELTRLARQRAADEVKPQAGERSFAAGDELALPGDAVTRQTWLLLLAESRAWQQSPAGRRETLIRLGGFFVLALLSLLLCRRFRVWTDASGRRLSHRVGFVLGLLALAGLASAKLILLSGLASPYFVPVALVAILATLAQGTRAGVVTGLLLAAWTALTGGLDFPLFFGLSAGALSAVLSAARIHTRRDVLLAGLRCGLCQGLAILAANFALTGATPHVVLLRAAWGLGNGLAVGLLLSATLPIFESLLRLTTDISLLEWSDQNHPVLREFARRAPGSYQHALRVGILAEAAAHAVSANPLLTRVGAYYHDLGKLPRPEYYVENEAGAASRHDQLTPELSALIVRSHVRDGVVLATTLGLPQPVIELIEQHHGTTLIKYFYRLALERAPGEAPLEATSPPSASPEPFGADPIPEPVVRLHRTRLFRRPGDWPGAPVPAPVAAFRREPGRGRGGAPRPGGVAEEFFRYPGPRPATREAALILLADQVEAASRALRDPTPMQLRNLVHDLAAERLAEGQFSECGLTLEELEAAEEAITRELLSMFHPRREYPQEPQAPRDPRELAPA